jgi:prepilin-type N-terminal cleavage/methylation domain-containing protein
MQLSKYRSGFTLIELLVVLAIIGIQVSLLLPAVQINRAKQNQTTALASALSIGMAQSTFRTSDLDGDAIDDYGTVAELCTLGLLCLPSPNIYDFSVTLTPPPLPGFEARAVPSEEKAARLRFYLNETGLTTFSETGVPGPASTPLVTGDECTVPPDPICDELVESTGDDSIQAMNLLSGAEHVQGAIDFFEQEDPIPVIITALDVNLDGTLGFEELLSADLLDVARDVISELGLDPGANVGSDMELQAILADYQSELELIFDLSVDAPQPELPVSDFSTDETQVVSYLQMLLAPNAVPSLGPLALAIAVLCLASVALAARRFRY